MNVSRVISSSSEQENTQENPLTVAPSDLNTQQLTVPETLRTVLVDPEGDVYLACENFEIRVSSRVLSLASKVFNVMFQTNFQEGLALEENETCSVPLPDDDSDAIHSVCLLLHHRHTEIIYQITPKFLLRTAILADKYACVSPLYYWADAKLRMLSERFQNAAYKNLDLLLAAYYFDLPSHFKLISRHIVFQGIDITSVDEHGMKCWEDEVDESDMPSRLLGKSTASIVGLLVLFK